MIGLGSHGYGRWHDGVKIRRDVCGMLIKQNGYCACCGCDLEGLKWAIDHNKQTMHVRGILCYANNTGLGKFGDNIAGLEQAIAYLRTAGES